MTSRPTVVALCCGIGVQEIALRRHFDTVLAVDCWRWAVYTHQRNFPHARAEWADIRDLAFLKWVAENYKGVDILMSAAPCVAFSPAGKRDPNDERGNLYCEVIRYVEALRPRVFVAENVPEVKKSSQMGFVLASLERLGYRWTTITCDAADYGTPQHRVRTFLVAVRGQLDLPGRPIPTHGNPGSEEVRTGRLRPWVTLAEAIGDLAGGRAFEKGCGKLSTCRRWVLSYVPMGGNWRDLPPPVLELVLAISRLCDRGDQALKRYDWPELAHSLRTAPSILAKTMPIHPGGGMAGLYRRLGPGAPAAALTTDPGQQTTMMAAPDPQQLLYWLRRNSVRHEPSNTLCTGPSLTHQILDYPPTAPRLAVEPEELRYWRGVYLEGRPRDESFEARMLANPAVADTRVLSVYEYERLMGISDEEGFVLLGDPGRPADVARNYKGLGNGIAVQQMDAICRVVSDVLRRCASPAGADPLPASRREGRRAAPDPAPVIVAPESGNTKTGPVAATYASQATCPPSCPLRRRGCYGENDNCRFHSALLNRSSVTDPVQIAALEARGIDALPGDLDLRVHVFGDCPDAESARLVGSAMAGYQRRGGRRAWAYTHAWREVPASAWQGANVLASCETTRQVKEANARGYAAALVVPEHHGQVAYVEDGLRVVPCPGQTSGRTCVECRMCMDVARLRRAGITIALAAHGAGGRAVREVLAELRETVGVAAATEPSISPAASVASRRRSGFTHESPVGGTDEWWTPKWVLDALGLEYDLDPASPGPGRTHVPAKQHYTRADDGLAQEWRGRVFCNPPYGPGIAEWVRKFVAHGDGIMLLPARTDTTWYHEHARRCDAMMFVRRRISFVRGDGLASGSPGVGSVLLACGPECVQALQRSRLGQFVDLRSARSQPLPVSSRPASGTARTINVVDEAAMLSMLARAKRPLLVEPVRGQYLPLGLAKAATYNKRHGGTPEFGPASAVTDAHDLVAVTTLFTYDADVYREALADVAAATDAPVLIGGICASLAPKLLEPRDDGPYPEKTYIFRSFSPILDQCVPDYSIDWGERDGWEKYSYVFTTRGCPNHCAYCAVPRLERTGGRVVVVPNWRDHIVRDRRTCVVLDNNPTAAPEGHLKELVDVLVELDLTVIMENGIDCKYVTPEVAALLARVRWAGNGLRIAFDRITEDGVFQRAVSMLLDAGVHRRKIMSYVLFGFNDTPRDAEYRLMECVRLGIQPYPQQYKKLNQANRRDVYVDKRRWTRKLGIVLAHFGVMGKFRVKGSLTEFVSFEQFVRRPEVQEKFGLQPEDLDALLRDPPYPSAYKRGLAPVLPQELMGMANARVAGRVADAMFRAARRDLVPAATIEASVKARIGS